MTNFELCRGKQNPVKINFVYVASVDMKNRLSKASIQF